MIKAANEKKNYHHRHFRHQHKNYSNNDEIRQ